MYTSVGFLGVLRPRAGTSTPQDGREDSVRSGQRDRETKAPRECLSRLSEASRRVNERLEFDQVLQGDEEVPEIDALAESPRPPLPPHAGNQYQDVVGSSAVVVLRNGSQPVVERAAAQGRSLAHHAEAASVEEGDGGVEPAPVVELHAGMETVCAGEE